MHINVFITCISDQLKIAIWMKGEDLNPNSNSICLNIEKKKLKRKKEKVYIHKSILSDY